MNVVNDSLQDLFNMYMSVFCYKKKQFSEAKKLTTVVARGLLNVITQDKS